MRESDSTAFSLVGEMSCHFFNFLCNNLFVYWFHRQSFKCWGSFDVTFSPCMDISIDSWMGEMENIIVIKRLWSGCDQAERRDCCQAFSFSKSHHAETYKAFRKMVVTLLQLINQLSITRASLLFIIMAALCYVIFTLIHCKLAYQTGVLIILLKLPSK